jgi:membrane-associated protease RseP (regulator of RpoE activity)
MRGPHVSLVTVIVKGGALGDVQTDQQNRICALRPASSAADAGLRIGDVIVSVDGGPLSRPLSVLLAEGEELTIELKRSMTLMGGMPAPPPNPAPKPLKSPGVGELPHIVLNISRLWLKSGIAPNIRAPRKKG